MTKRILATMLAVLMVFSALMLAACTNSTPANTGDQQRDHRQDTDDGGATSPSPKPVTTEAKST